MKRINIPLRINNKNLHYHPSRWTLIRGTALAVGSLIVVSAIPFFTAGYTSDVYLQVPATENAAATDYLPVSADMYDLTDRNSDIAITGASSDTLSASAAVNSTASQNAAAVEQNTYAITEQTAEDGTPVELLDVTQFTADNTVVYINTSSANVRSLPNSSGVLVATLSYSNTATRIGTGTSCL